MTTLQRPIFVVGCPRSGTTLVQCILSASSRAFSLPETHFFSGVLPTLGLSPHTPVTAAAIGGMRRELQAEGELVLPASFWETLSADTAVDVFVAVVEHFRPEQKERVIEKTPRHVLHMETIQQAFPDAVFVNVIRDPIDVASSLQGVPFESSRSVLSHAQRWLESIEAAERYALRHAGTLHNVVYETLVKQPEATVRSMCEFVGLDYEPTMLEEFGKEASRNVGRGEAWKRDVAGGVIVDRKGVWRTRMSPGEAWLVAQATGGARRRYGYTDLPGASASSIASAALREARVRFREARGSVGIVGAARHAGSVLKTLAPA